MRDLTAQEIIMKPLVTEKAVAQEEKRTYVFLVHPGATKIQIRRAIEDIYKVHVTGVNTAKIQGRRKRYRYQRYLTSEGKKAMVTLAENERIDII
jgi:large subunit ribosomal protein L23